MKVTGVERRKAQPAEHPEYFQGTVHMQPLYQPDRDGEESELVAVFFDPGARTKPHVHESAQVLHVVYGHCVIATESERKVVGEGDYVIVPRETWHWHGATGEGAMCHISIKLPGRTNWEVPEKNWAET